MLRVRWQESRDYKESNNLHNPRKHGFSTERSSYIQPSDQYNNILQEQENKQNYWRKVEASQKPLPSVIKVS